MTITANGQNLALHYTMDNVTASAGPTGDLIPNGTGTAANLDSLGATMTTGEYCGSFLNGAGYRSTAALSNVGWTGIALSYWYKSQSNFQGVIFQGAYLGFGSRILSDGRIEGTFDGSASGSHTSITSVNDGIWHHIVIQNGGSTTQIYIDGVLDNSGPETLYTMPSPNPLASIYMGSHINDAANEKIYGKVDEVKVFDNILSQTQIDNLFAYGACLVNIPDANFKAYLVGNTSINTNADTEIQCSEASAFTGTIECNGMSISSLSGIEQFTSVTVIICYTNQISLVDLSYNTALTTFNCAFNQFTSLDFSNNPALTTLSCSYNQLTSLNIANGNNSDITYLETDPNSNLTCIQVDNVAYSSSNWTTGNYIVGSGTSYSTNCLNCIVNIPDANFKAYLVGNTSINTNADTEIQCSEASSYNGPIYATGASIADLTGIEAFTACQTLYVTGNQLTTVDLSQNAALITFFCEQNQLTSLDFSNNPLLYSVNASQNLLTSINLSSNSNLTSLDLALNELPTIDVSSNTALTILRVGQNNLTALSLSSNTALESLGCQGNQITSLDISQLPAVIGVNCHNNPFNTLNLANGNNSNFTFVIAGTNPNLTCIEVDDVSYSTANWTGTNFQFDPVSSFSTDCATFLSLENKENISVNIFPNPASDVITVNTSAQIEEVNVFDTYGNLVNTFNASTFSVSHLSAGIYFLTVSTDKGTVQNKFIKK